MKYAGIVIFLLMIRLTAPAQNIGSRVSFPGTDGRTYTGTIKSIQNNKYYVKYDGYDFSAWLDANQFTLMGAKPTEDLVGTKISFKGTDGKTYTGTITSAEGNGYRVKYDSYNYESYITREQFNVINMRGDQNLEKELTRTETNYQSGDLAAIFAFGKQQGWASGVLETKFNNYVRQLSTSDKAKVAGIIGAATTASARFFALKSMMSGDSYEEAKNFISQLNKYPESYQQEHCLLTTHRSIIQQWEYSCSVTVVQTYLGDLCPRYAWEIKQTADYDKVSNDPYQNAMGVQQKMLLEKYGGVASIRGDYTGKYIAINDALDQLVGGILGVHHTTRQVTESVPVTLQHIRTEADRGFDVPLLIGFVGSQARHFLLMMKYKYSGGEYQYLIYDPWDGVCDWVKQSTIVGGSLSPLLTQWRISLDYYYTAD